MKSLFLVSAVASTMPGNLGSIDLLYSISLRLGLTGLPSSPMIEKFVCGSRG